MKKLLLIPILFIFLLGCAGMQKKPVDYTGLFEKSATATKMYGRDALLGGTKACDNISAPIDGTICQVIDSSNYYWLYIFDTTSDQTEADPWYANPNDATSGDWVLIYNPGNGNKSLAHSSENDAIGTITVKDWYQNKEWDNQGAYAGESDWILPVFPRKATRTVTTEEAQVIEICPPTGETMYLDGNTMDANDCINTDNTTGSVIAIKRMQNASGTWYYSIINISGAAVDAGAPD